MLLTVDELNRKLSKLIAGFRCGRQQAVVKQEVARPDVEEVRQGGAAPGHLLCRCDAFEESAMSHAKARDLMRLAEMAAARHSGVSLAEIAEAFAADHRTAQRMARALEDTFPASRSAPTRTAAAAGSCATPASPASRAVSYTHLTLPTNSRV